MYSVQCLRWLGGLVSDRSKYLRVLFCTCTGGPFIIEYRARCKAGLVFTYLIKFLCCIGGDFRSDVGNKSTDNRVAQTIGHGNYQLKEICENSNVVGRGVMVY